MAGCSIREEGLRAAALPGRVAAAHPMTLDAGPRADERVGHIYQSVVGLALREQVLLGREFEPSDGGVARVPEPRQVLEVRAARFPSTDENVVVQAWLAPRRVRAGAVSCLEAERPLRRRPDDKHDHNGPKK